MCIEKNRDINADVACPPKGRKAGKIFVSNFLIRCAFTLAEVLIVLGIIGIVAEMTIPTLISSFQEQVLLTRFRQTYTSLQQAYQMAAVDNGTADTWADADAMYTNLRPYLKMMQDCPFTCDTAYPADPKNLAGTSTSDWHPYYHIMLANGATLKFTIDEDKDEDVDLEYRTIAIDLNGNKGPNRIGYDFFTFHLSNKNGAPFVSWPYYSGNGSSWVEVDPYSCNRTSLAVDSNSGYGCSYWLIRNWNMDYLHRTLSNAEWVK
jgi:prepilin-type N-terminal cleavage/methylation domain-containing protein